MKAYWKSGGISPHILLTSVLDGGEWSALCRGRFTPRERAHGTHWIGGWVGPRAVLEGMVRRKIHSPRQGSNPRIPIVQPVAQRYTTELSYLRTTFLNYSMCGKTILIFLSDIREEGNDVEKSQQSAIDFFSVLQRHWEKCKHRATKMSQFLRLCVKSTHR
jgi:hypothetical protein